MLTSAHNAKRLAKHAASRFEHLGHHHLFSRICAHQADTAHAGWCLAAQQIEHCRGDVDDAGWCLTQPGASTTRNPTKDEYGVEFVPVEPTMHAATDRYTTGDQAEARQAVCVCFRG